MIEKVWLKLIQTRVRKYLVEKDWRVFIFGSRATDNNLRYSDVDIGIMGKGRIRGRLLTAIEEELENSQLPYRTNLIDFQRVSADFKKVALKKVINL